MGRESMSFAEACGNDYRVVLGHHRAQKMSMRLPFQQELDDVAARATRHLARSPQSPRPVHHR